MATSTVRTTRNAMGALHELFDGRISSTGLCPPRSPDLSSYDFCLWGSLNAIAYRDIPRTAKTLTNEMKHLTASNSADELRSVLQGSFLRREAGLKAAGNHFEHFLTSGRFSYHFTFHFICYLNRSFEMRADILVLKLNATSLPLAELTRVSGRCGR
jgi:hypothetical protein